MSQTITLPRTIDDGRLDTVLFLLNESKRLGNTDEELVLDWHKTREISPAGYAIICCIFDTLVEQRAAVTNVHMPEALMSIPPLNNLSRIKTFQSLPAPSVHSFERRDLILRGKATGIDPLFREYFEAKFSSLLTEDQMYSCELIINELMQNTVDHSTAERYYLYGGTWNDEFHFGLCDMGATIPAKLEQKYHCENDCEYLQLALKKGVGTRRTRQGGLGLYYFFEYVKELPRGKLTILSRNGQVRRYFETRRSQITSLKYTLNGTWCFARFQTEG